MLWIVHFWQQTQQQTPPAPHPTGEQVTTAIEWTVIRISVLGGTCLSLIGGLIRGFFQFLEGLVVDLAGFRAKRRKVSAAPPEDL